MDTLAAGSPGQRRKTMIRQRIFTVMAGTAVVAGAALGCEPGSITEARLGENAEGILTLLLPLAEDTFAVANLLPEDDTTSTPAGVLAVEVVGSNFSFSVAQGVAFANQQSGRVDPGEVDLGDMEDPIDQSSLNDARLELTFTGGPTPVTVDNFLLRAVRVDIPGQPFVLDGAGIPVELSLADPGLTTLSIPQIPTSVNVQAAPFVDGVLHTLLDDEGVALVAQGTTTQGPVFPALLNFNFDLVVGLDITIPMAGVSFTRNQVVETAGFDEDDADDLSSRLVSAAAVTAVENSTPFGASVQIALAPDSIDGDVFAHPEVVLLDAISLGAPAVNASGIPIAATADTVELTIAGDDSRLLLVCRRLCTTRSDSVYTAALRVTLVPGAGGGGRGAIRVGDAVMVDASVEIMIRRGN
jgi:hypothetical protein